MQRSLPTPTKSGLPRTDPVALPFHALSLRDRWSTFSLETKHPFTSFIISTIDWNIASLITARLPFLCQHETSLASVRFFHSTRSDLFWPLAFLLLQWIYSHQSHNAGLPLLLYKVSHLVWKCSCFSNHDLHQSIELHVLYCGKGLQLVCAISLVLYLLPFILHGWQVIFNLFPYLYSYTSVSSSSVM